MSVPCANPNGHFYSPVVNTDELARRSTQVWPAHPVAQGVRFDAAAHRRIVEQFIAPVARDYPFPIERPAELRYFEHNDQFGRTDARVLYSFLRTLKPRRVIEVGSGFSTLLMAETMARHLDPGTELICIEPYPREFLVRGVSGVSRLIRSQVQDVEPAEFERLESGDVLFIDSSHVAKTGSDVVWLFLQVLPRLAPGVLVHVHDIFLPGDYPRRWALEENRSWNEQYLLHALLMFSTRFSVFFGNAFALSAVSEELGAAMGLPSTQLYSAGSLWIRVDG